jgi:hypothetical protein
VTVFLALGPNFRATGFHEGAARLLANLARRDRLGRVGVLWQQEEGASLFEFWENSEGSSHIWERRLANPSPAATRASDPATALAELLPARTEPHERQSPVLTAVLLGAGVELPADSPWRGEAGPWAWYLRRRRALGGPLAFAGIVEPGAEDQPCAAALRELIHLSPGVQRLDQGLFRWDATDPTDHTADVLGDRLLAAADRLALKAQVRRARLAGLLPKS